MEQASIMGVKDGQERQLSEGESHRRTYAIAAVRSLTPTLMFFSPQTIDFAI